MVAHFNSNGERIDPIQVSLKSCEELPLKMDPKYVQEWLGETRLVIFFYNLI